ncbi:hypothetical protein [Nitrospira sp. Nam80]
MNAGWVIVTAAVWLSGCGVIGAPVAPEDVGVAPIIERQKEREQDMSSRGVPDSAGPPLMYPGLRAGEGDASQSTDDLPVPPLQSVGTKP